MTTQQQQGGSEPPLTPKEQQTQGKGVSVNETDVYTALAAYNPLFNQASWNQVQSAVDDAFNEIDRKRIPDAAKENEKKQIAERLLKGGLQQIVFTELVSNAPKDFDAQWTSLMEDLKVSQSDPLLYTPKQRDAFEFFRAELAASKDTEKAKFLTQYQQQVAGFLTRLSPNDANMRDPTATADALTTYRTTAAANYFKYNEKDMVSKATGEVVDDTSTNWVNSLNRTIATRVQVKEKEANDKAGFNRAFNDAIGSLVDIRTPEAQSLLTKLLAQRGTLADRYVMATLQDPLLIPEQFVQQMVPLDQIDAVVKAEADRVAGEKQKAADIKAQQAAITAQTQKNEAIISSGKPYVLDEKGNAIEVKGAPEGATGQQKPALDVEGFYRRVLAGELDAKEAAQQITLFANANPHDPNANFYHQMAQQISGTDMSSAAANESNPVGYATARLRELQAQLAQATTPEQKAQLQQQIATWTAQRDNMTRDLNTPVGQQRLAQVRARQQGPAFDPTGAGAAIQPFGQPISSSSPPPPSGAPGAGAVTPSAPGAPTTMGTPAAGPPGSIGSPGTDPAAVKAIKEQQAMASQQTFATQQEKILKAREEEKARAMPKATVRRR